MSYNLEGIANVGDAQFPFICQTCPAGFELLADTGSLGQSVLNRLQHIRIVLLHKLFPTQMFPTRCAVAEVPADVSEILVVRVRTSADPAFAVAFPQELLLLRQDRDRPGRPVGLRLGRDYEASHLTIWPGGDAMIPPAEVRSGFIEIVDPGTAGAVEELQPIPLEGGADSLFNVESKSTKPRS